MRSLIKRFLVSGLLLLSCAPALLGQAKSTQPIALHVATFDSGFGGFFTAKSIEKVTPPLLERYDTAITIRHYGDTLNSPYGEKFPAEIAKLGSDGVLKALDEEKLLTLFCPGLTGSKLNAAAFQKVAKMKAAVPFGFELPTDWYALNLWCLMQPLAQKEKSALLAHTAMSHEEAEPWQKLEAHSKKLETALKSAKLNRASLLWQALKGARGEQVFLLSLKSGERLVQDRLKNYFGKYLAIVAEIPDTEVTDSTGVAAGTPEFFKARETYVAARLDGRIKKPIVPEPEPEPIQQPRGPFARSARPKQV